MEPAPAFGGISSARQAAFVYYHSLSYSSPKGEPARVYKVKVFARFQRRERIADASLAKAVRSAENGLVDADLGGGLIKQRVARSGQGKSGGYRTVIAYRARDRSVFLFGFAKSTKADLKPDELADLAKIGARWLKASEQEVEAAIADDELKDVDYAEEDESEG